MKARYNALKEDAEQAVLSLSREIGDIIACSGEKSGWIAHFQQYHDFTELTRRMVITLVDSLTVYPGSRLDVLFRYRYGWHDFEIVGRRHILRHPAGRMLRCQRQIVRLLHGGGLFVKNRSRRLDIRVGVSGR